MASKDEIFVYNKMIKSERIPLLKKSLSKWISLKKDTRNDFLNKLKTNDKTKEFNRFIGYVGEYESSLYFYRKGFSLSYKWPIDLIISIENKSCAIDVKTTSKDKWVPKKYFKNKENQLEFFGYCIDEYLRVKILLNPFQIIFNEDDLNIILSYF